MELLKNNEKRAKIVINFIWAVLFLEIVLFCSHSLQYYLLYKSKYGAPLSTDTANENDLRETILGILYLLVYIGSVITFIQWFRRAYYNLHQKALSLTFSEGWAAGCWFVPIISLYRPYQIMKELYTETGFLLSKNNIENKLMNVKHLGWWWTLLIVSAIFEKVVFRMENNAKWLDDYLTLTKMEMIVKLLDILLALITIQVIKRYSAVENLLEDIKSEKPLEQIG